MVVAQHPIEGNGWCSYTLSIVFRILIAEVLRSIHETAGTIKNNEFDRVLVDSSHAIRVWEDYYLFFVPIVATQRTGPC